MNKICTSANEEWRDAVALFKTYMGEDYKDEPRNVRAIGSDNYIFEYDALIKEV